MIIDLSLSIEWISVSVELSLPLSRASVQRSKARNLAGCG
jgi:hypothetical protein